MNLHLANYQHDLKNWITLKAEQENDFFAIFSPAIKFVPFFYLYWVRLDNSYNSVRIGILRNFKLIYVHILSFYVLIVW